MSDGRQKNIVELSLQLAALFFVAIQVAKKGCYARINKTHYSSQKKETVIILIQFYVSRYRISDAD